MSDQPLVGSVDTAAVPAPGYYPDPSVPGFVRYWNGGTWVPGTSRPAPAEGEVLEAPRFAARPSPRPNARYIPPPAAPVVPAPPGAEGGAVETGPVFLDRTEVRAVLTQPEPEPGSAGVGSGWQADPRAQRGLLETGTAPRWVSWGVVREGMGEEPAAACPAPAPAVAPSTAEPVAGRSAPPTPAATPAAPVPVPVAVPASRGLALQKSAQPASPAVHRRRPPAVAPAPARPAGFGRRLAARLLDSAVLLAVTAAVAFPLAVETIADMQAKLARARAISRLTGRGVQVWLVDGVVLGRVALLLGVLLLAGLLYEVLPTSRTGRTLGKRVLGLRVVRTDGRRPPTLGRSLVRWLVRQLAALSVVGLFAVLFDRQQRRGWQDRAARTKVVEG